MLQGRGFFLTNSSVSMLCSTISMGSYGMVQRIAVAVLKTFTMMNKDGGIHPRTMLAANSEGI